MYGVCEGLQAGAGSSGVTVALKEAQRASGARTTPPQGLSQTPAASAFPSRQSSTLLPPRLAVFSLRLDSLPSCSCCHEPQNLVILKSH